MNIPNVPHQPSHRQAIIFFFLTLIIAACITVWVFYINKGRIVVETGFPLRIKVLSEDVLCTARPCRITLAPGQYTITLNKEGYFDYTETVTVKLRKDVNINPKFQFIPAVYEIKDASLSFIAAPLRPPFLGQKSLLNFPKNVKSATFSASGDLALLTIGKDIYLYNLKNKSVSNVNLNSDLGPVWTGEKIAFLEASDKGQALKVGSPLNDKYQPVASFEKKFNAPEILGDMQGKKILISEETENGHAYYLIDLEKESRKRLNIPADITEIKWTLEHIVYKIKTDTKVFVLDPNTMTETSLRALEIENLIEPAKNIFFFTSSEKQNTGSAKVGLSITDALEMAQQTAKTAQEAGTLFIIQYNSQDDVYRTLVSIPIGKNEIIHRLTKDPNGKDLYFEKGGKFFVVKM